jgi:methionine--tRNA ligase beta chain
MKETITFKEFQRMDLRVGRVLEARDVPNSRNLILLKMDIGTDIKQMVAAIKGFYEPEDLIGKNIATIVNLEPRRVMGLESQGMILAAVEGEKPVILMPDKEVAPGSPIT